jgi:protein phosphatase 1 regulatory subunit 42
VFDRLSNYIAHKLCPLVLTSLLCAVIAALEGLSGLPCLTHLYLNDNLLPSISGLGALTGLQKLYLQGNCIQVGGLGAAHLASMTCNVQPSNDSLGFDATHKHNNCVLPFTCAYHSPYPLRACLSVQVVSGLESLLCLEELHISNQRLPPGQSLVFDPASLEAVAPTLRVLCASNCGLQVYTRVVVAV